MKNKKIRDVVIDVDHAFFFVAKSKQYKDGLAGKELNSKLDMKPYIEHLKDIVADYITTAEVESIAYGWSIGEVKVVVSDKTNFRYKIYPEYKKNRSNHQEDKVLLKLKKWARKNYICEPNTEADDVVAYYVNKGGIGFTTDKDLFNGVKGLWFNTHHAHRCWVKTSKKQAEYFFKLQVLAGDGVDGIPSIEGVGLKTADKLMQKHGSDWKDIESIFKSKGYSKKYMVKMARLVSMTQWTPKKGVKLWKLPN